jgi:flavin reductase (DIM6/NTAB) family NADH-FMN oxidoreductase RutF
MAYMDRQAVKLPTIAASRARPLANAETFRLAMREFASGVAIVAAGRDETRSGCTATSLCSLSMDPPTLIVCLALRSATLATIRAEGVFGLSILAGQHAELAERFAGGGGLHGAARFAGCDWTHLTTGAPLLQQAVALIDCEVEEAIERHTHAIVIGRVVAMKAESRRPLLHWRGRCMPA